MTADLGVGINWMLVVAALCAAALWIGLWNHPEALRKIAARYLARAEALDRSRDVYIRALTLWEKRLNIPARNGSDLSSKRRSGSRVFSA